MAFTIYTFPPLITTSTVLVLSLVWPCLIATDIARLMLDKQAKVPRAASQIHALDPEGGFLRAAAQGSDGGIRQFCSVNWRPFWHGAYPVGEIAPRVGVGVIVLRDDMVLLGQRIGSHGAGTWALPGGHLEYGEDVEQCAVREVMEETGLDVQVVARGPYTSNIFLQEGKHYVTLFVVARALTGNPVVREPSKCLGWRWFRWSAPPSPLFPPLDSLYASGFVPENVA